MYTDEHAALPPATANGRSPNDSIVTREHSGGGWRNVRQVTLVRWLCLALTVGPCQAMCLDRNVLVANGTYAHPFEPLRDRRVGKLHVCGCEFANQEVLTGRASLPAVRVGSAARLRRRGPQGRGRRLARALDDAKRRQLLASTTSWR